MWLFVSSLPSPQESVETMSAVEGDELLSAFSGRGPSTLGDLSPDAL